MAQPAPTQEEKKSLHINDLATVLPQITTSVASQYGMQALGGLGGMLMTGLGALLPQVSKDQAVDAGVKTVKNLQDKAYMPTNPYARALLGYAGEKLAPVTDAYEEVRRAAADPAAENFNSPAAGALVYTAPDIIAEGLPITKLLRAGARGTRFDVPLEVGDAGRQATGIGSREGGMVSSFRAADDPPWQRLEAGSTAAAQGMDAENVWKSYRVYKDEDGHWRWEFPDTEAKLKIGDMDVQQMSMSEVKANLKDAKKMAKEFAATKVTQFKAGTPEWNDAIAILKKLEAEVAKWHSIAKGRTPLPTIGVSGAKLSETPIPLKDVLDHPTFFKQYPNAGNAVRVRHLTQQEMKKRPNIYGFMGYDGTLALNPTLSPEEMMSTMLHEVQHNVQNLEGLAKGGGKEYMPTFKKLLPDLEKQAERELRNAHTKVKTLEHRGRSEEHDKWVEASARRDAAKEALKIINETQENIKRHKLNTNTGKFNAYESLLGEMESRLTELRRELGYDLYPLAHRQKLADFGGNFAAPLVMHHPRSDMYLVPPSDLYGAELVDFYKKQRANP
jgi:hypothetical protein